MYSLPRHDILKPREHCYGNGYVKGKCRCCDRHEAVSPAIAARSRKRESHLGRGGEHYLRPLPDGITPNASDMAVERSNTVMDYIWRYVSPLGGITLASDGNALTGLWFDGQKYFASTLAYDYREKMIPVFGKAIDWMDVFFSGSDPGPTPPLAPAGTPFRRAVWEILRSIPYGQTMTYGAVAKLLSEQEGRGAVAARAVGSAVGHNPISLFIPCHRVIGADGSLTGYAGGLERKRNLLLLERSNTTNL